MIIKRKDWSGWLSGLRTSALAAGAKAVSGSLGTFLTTNGIDSLHIPHLEGIGMNWKSALVQLCVQFVLHSSLAASKYVADKPDADTISEDIPTEFITKEQTNEKTNP